MKHLYPIITTPALRECRDFYVKVLNARVLFQQDWYVHLSIGGWEIGFLMPNPPKRLPVFQHAALSRGLCLALEVEDVIEVHDQFVKKGIEMLGQLSSFPGGEKAFSVMDPAGVVLNIVERSNETAEGVFEV
ncbi:MAG TPA: VOC family protein [Solimonas sp.]|nr:VOC family protein [Solimonas sp.]